MRQFINTYIILPVLFVIVYGGMIIAAVRQRMQNEDRARKFGF